MKKDATRHAVILPEIKSLCGLDSHTIPPGWVFTEKDMKLRNGQQYNLFKSSVTCKKCLQIVKDQMLIEDTLAEPNCVS